MRRAGESVELNDCLVLTDHEYEKLTENKVKTPLIDISSTGIRKAFKARV